MYPLLFTHCYMYPSYDFKGATPIDMVLRLVPEMKDYLQWDYELHGKKYRMGNQAEDNGPFNFPDKR